MNTPLTCLNRLLYLFRHGACVGAGTLILILTFLAGQPAAGADESGLGDKTKAAAHESTAAVEAAGRSVAADADQLWQRIDAARLKNRTPDEIVAWVIMGVLVGAVAGMMTSRKLTGFGKLRLLLLGLAGSFIGGMVVRVTHLDFGWGPVLIRYEELAFSFLGALLLFVLARLVRARAQKGETKP
jgi:uncharacterized membrane protein YeaQ/YmgE (transglycosylase-associated protein family)